MTDRSSERTCTTCGESKPISEYHRKKAGHQPKCKPCANAYTAAYRDAHPEKIKAHSAEYRQRHNELEKDRLRRIREQGGDAYQAYLAYHRAHHAARDRGHVASVRSAWLSRPENRARALENTRRMNHIRRIASRDGERFDYAEIYERDRGMCHLCGGRVSADDWHLDHIVPIACGGEHTRANVAVSHPACNLRKGARPMGEQLRLIG